MRSAVIGLRLCGIADEPFWPRPNGSSTSRTSVRARCRISVAKRSSEEASERERRQQLRVPVALQDLRRAGRRLEAEPLAGHPLDLGVGGGVGADGARELADAQALDRAAEPLAVAVERERPTGELEPERRRLGVDAVGAPHADRLAVLLRPRDDGAEGAVDPLEHERPGVLDGERERRVEHVRRRQPVVEEAALLAQSLGDGVDEGGDVVVRLALDLGDRSGVGTTARSRIAATRLAWDGANLGPALEGSQLDVEPAPQLLASPTRCGSWPGGSSGRSRFHSRSRSGGSRAGVRRAGRISRSS